LVELSRDGAPPRSARRMSRSGHYAVAVHQRCRLRVRPAWPGSWRYDGWAQLARSRTRETGRNRSRLPDCFRSVPADTLSSLRRLVERSSPRPVPFLAPSPQPLERRTVPATRGWGE
jgi:hypothetical protein